jgi:hypothetical protein
MPEWKKQCAGVEELKLAVMRIGISLPGTFEEPKAPVYVGMPARLTRQCNIFEHSSSRSPSTRKMSTFQT